VKRDQFADLETRLQQFNADYHVLSDKV
jgi:hypothetical protein